MPELPELQALAEGLQRSLAGRRVTAFHLRLHAALRSVSPPPQAIVGQTINSVWRRGKLLGITGERLTLTIHLMSAGRIAVVPAADPPPRRGVVADIDLDDGRRLRLREWARRHRARVDLVTNVALEAHPPLARLGPEPLELDASGWESALARPSARLHSALRDGRRVAGIGRCYADEIMWAARLAPYAMTDRLDDAQWRALAEGASIVLEQALARARERISTELPTREYRVTAAHGHYGDPCLRCGTALKRVSFADYELVYCAPCQTDGRVYADRRRSRLLR